MFSATFRSVVRHIFQKSARTGTFNTRFLYTFSFKLFYIVAKWKLFKMNNVIGKEFTKTSLKYTHCDNCVSKNRMNWSFYFYTCGNFLKKIVEGHVLCVGPLIPPFWTSGDISSGFQSQSGQSYSHLVEAYVLHIPRDSPLVQHLPTSWRPAWQEILYCSLNNVPIT